MRMRCVVAGVLTGIAASLVQGQPLETRTSPIDEQTQEVLTSVFEDRSGPRLYRHDTVPPSHFLHSSPSVEWVGIHGFDAIGGKDIITSISCMWGNCANGATGRLLVWQADSTGSLRTAVPLLDQPVTIRDAKTGRYSEYVLSTPVTVTGRFYVGYAAVVIGDESFYMVPMTTLPTPPGRAWIGTRGTAATPQDLADAAVSLDPLNYCFPLRASGAAGAITYQGRLADGGASFTGPADMQFRFFDSPSGSTPLSPKFTNLAVPVTQGLFTVDLPGSESWFTNAPDVYLEIEVRRGGDDYVTLSPRQRITRSPAALHAVRAAAADVADSAITAQSANTAALAQGVPWSGVTGIPASVANAFSPWIGGANSIISYSSGNVGIGTTQPNERLEIAGGPVGTGWLARFSNPSVGNSAFRTTGMRVSDDGFFEVANSVAAGAPNFARLNGNGVWSAVSDARLKADVTPDDPAEMLAAALKLRPVHLVWKKSGAADSGLLAQEVREVLPDLVTGDESRGVLTVDYSKVGVVAVGAIQEQQKKIDRLEAENRSLLERLERLEAAFRDSAGKR